MRVKTHDLLLDQIEKGLEYGLMKAEKYNTQPTAEFLIDHVMNSIAEYFDWEDEFAD